MVKQAERTPDPNPLKRFLDAPGGISEKDAIQRATDSLEMIRHEALEEIDTCLAQIGALAEMRSPSPATQHALHQYGNSILSFAGMYDLPDLCAAAYSLCELIDAMMSNGRWEVAGIVIHHDAMRKLREPKRLSLEERERLVSGLRKVTQRIGGVTPRVKP